jgi:hypothetical protein
LVCEISSNRFQIPAPPPFQLQFEAPVLYLAPAHGADSRVVK